jgi:hypothetical protein
MAIRRTFPAIGARARAALLERQANRRAGGQGFDYPTSAVGATPDGLVTVYYDPSLGQQGLTLAQNLLAGASRIFGACASYFGIAGSPVSVVVAPLSGNNDGSGGAYHYGCDFTAGGVLYLDAAFGNDAVETGLFVAELTECFMGAQAKGWDCGVSNGEALSRFLAELQSGGPTGALADFATGPAWYQAGRPNWIDAVEPTDQDDVSIGCGIVYLYWMVSQGFTAAQITQAGGATLADNYKALTGKATAWSDFSAAVAALSGVATDNPWTGATPPAQPPPPPDPPTRLFSLTFAHSVPKGGVVAFRAPVPIPAGTYDLDADTTGMNVLIAGD